MLYSAEHRRLLSDALPSQTSVVQSFPFAHSWTARVRPRWFRCSRRARRTAVNLGSLHCRTFHIQWCLDDVYHSIHPRGYDWTGTVDTRVAISELHEFPRSLSPPLGDRTSSSPCHPRPTEPGRLALSAHNPPSPSFARIVRAHPQLTFRRTRIFIANDDRQGRQVQLARRLRRFSCWRLGQAQSMLSALARCVGTPDVSRQTYNATWLTNSASRPHRSLGAVTG